MQRSKTTFSAGLKSGESLQNKIKKLFVENKTEKSIYKVCLNATELDKFKEMDKHPTLHVLTSFYIDEHCDHIFFS